MMSGRGRRGAGTRLPEGQREIEKRRWMKRTWINNWEEMDDSLTSLTYIY